VSRGREWWALAALVLLSTGLRAWAALKVPVPWIAPDEMVYGLLGRDLWLHGSLSILGGSTPYYSLLTPLLAGFPLAAFGLGTGYDVLHGLQAFVMSLAAVPVYLWGRTLVSRRAAFAAAALTVATPVLAYSGLMMTEVLFYPLLTVAAWTGAEAIGRPTRRNQILMLVAFVAVCATRIQAIVLVPALITAVLVDAGISRSWRRLGRHLPALAGLAVLLVVWVVWRLASGSGTLGGYEVLAKTSYSVGDAAKFVVYHGASLLILCGLIPVAAVTLMLVEAVRRGEPDERVRAYLAVASSLSVWIVVEVGVFASRYSDRIVERNLIGLAPMLFLGLVLWLERGPDGGWIERAVVGMLGLTLLVVLPVDRYVTILNIHDAMTLIPLYQFSTATSMHALTRVYPIVAAVVVVVFVLVPRRRLKWVPVALLVALVGASVLASRFVVREAKAQQRTFLGADPSWIDHAGGDKVAYLYDGEPSWPGVWQTVFFNPSIYRVDDLPDTTVPGPLPQTPVNVLPNGMIITPPSVSRQPAYVVASSWIELDGDRVAQVAQSGISQPGLVLWNVKHPVKMLSRVTGLQPNGDIYGPTAGALTVYDCRSGRFRVTLLVKQSGPVDIKVNGKVIKHLDFKGPQPSWHGELPIKSDGGRCVIEVQQNGLIGTTQFAFDRG
jgi:hypothetical protein